MLRDIDFSFLDPRLFALIGLVIVTVHFVRLYYQHGLNQFNGPFLASFSNLWRYWNTRINRAKVPALVLQQKYGNVVRVGPKALLFNHPQAIADIYGAGKEFTKVRNVT